MIRTGTPLRKHRLTGLIAILALLAFALPIARAQDDPTAEPAPDPPPFSLPFADPPGPNTWLYEQHYGNTTSAFNYGREWYFAGQGMHFGLDLEAACGTPVLAIADGVVTSVDAESFGAGPHTLVLEHPGTGLVSLYGHLLERPNLERGQAVERGQQIGLSGDPDLSCESRPHLHLEIREVGYQVALNPLPFFDVNWHMIASMGPFTNQFQQDIDRPYRWMKIDDQPEIRFGGDYLNNYLRPWPVKLERRAPINPPVVRRLDPLPEDGVTVTQAAVTLDRWNIGAWWDPTDPDAVYLMDAVPGQQTGVFRQPLDGGTRTYIEPAPPAQLSPGGTIAITSIGGGSVRVTHRTDGQSWEIYTEGSFPAVSPGETRLMWEVLFGEVTPGMTDPGMAIWVSNLDGSDQRRVHVQSGGYSLWLDDHRLLIIKRIIYSADTQVFIMDLDAQPLDLQMLGTYRFLRGIQVSPGGEWIAYWLPFQDDPAASGIYVQRTEIGAQPRKLDFWGAYRWRDDRSLYTLSFDPAQDVHALGYVDVTTGEHRWLTDPEDLPIRVANGEWSVSPDGTRIVYVDPTDYGLYMLTVSEG